MVSRHRVFYPVREEDHRDTCRPPKEEEGSNRGVSLSLLGRWWCPTFLALCTTYLYPQTAKTTIYSNANVAQFWRA